MIAFVKDISDDVLRWYLYRASHRYQWELEVRFCSVVQLYAEVKQLSIEIVSMLLKLSTFAKKFLQSLESRLFGDINAIFEFHFTSLFLATLFNVCSTLLVLQMQLVKY